MALASLQFFASTIGKHVEAQVLLPDAAVGAGPFPVFYLLHGLSDDSSIWMRLTRLEMYVKGLPLIVVMPDGFRSFYTDAKEGMPFGKYIGEELIETVDRYFPTIKDRSGRAIGGLSMGGYGALRTALTYPEKFVSANSHSGAVMAGTKRWDVQHDRLDATEFLRVFGANPIGSKHDILALAKDIPKKKLPKLKLDCGTEDFLLEDNREVHRKLTALRVPHEYNEYPGGHNWDYWDLHVREALAFHAKHLGIEK